MKLCSIASSSSGNCICVGSDNTTILIDAGISGKKVEQGLNSIDMTTKDVDGILVTHEHIDHIKGLGVLARKYGIPMYATPGTLASIMQNTSLGKIPDGLFVTIAEDMPFFIGDLEIQPFAISHDAAQPVGYRVSHEGKSMGLATDMGKYSDYIVDKLSGLDVLLLEANHDVNMLQVGSYPYYLKQRILGDRGHLSNEMAGRLLGEILHDGMKHVVLGHLSKENNYAALAYETVCTEVTMGDNPWHSKDFDIQVANREDVSQLINF